MRRGPVENTCSIDMRVSLKSGEVKDWANSAHANTDTRAALAELIETLRALGLEVQQDKSNLHIAFPRAKEAKRIRNRGGGRPTKHTDRYEIEDMEDGELKDLMLEFKACTSDTARVAFFDKRGAETTARACGVSPATIYRRLPEWREGKRREDLQAQYDSLPFDERMAWLCCLDWKDAYRIVGIPQKRLGSHDEFKKVAQAKIDREQQEYDEHMKQLQQELDSKFGLQD